MRRPFTALGLAGLAVACSDEPVLHKLPPPAVQIDELKQRPAALVDILWVVDSSCSAADKQKLLAGNFNRFIQSLTVCPNASDPADLCDFETKKCLISGGACNPPDYHVGVITLDAQSAVDSGKLRRAGLCVPSRGSMPAAGKYKYCQGDDHQCDYDRSDPDSDAGNKVCDMTPPDMGGPAIAFVTPTTPSNIKAFGRLVDVGIAGSGFDQGIKTAATAIGRDTDRTTGQFKPPPSENAGFLRDEASLYVIFVTDAPDNSFGDVAYFYRAFASVKGAGNESLVSASAIVGDPALHGRKGNPPGGCKSPPPDNATAEPGMRYIALAMYTRGIATDYRVCDDKRLTCGTGQACQTPVPDLPGICVPTAACGSDADCGTTKCGGHGCITCDAGKCNLKPENVTSFLTQKGVFGSVCNPDYGSVLGNLGFDAAGLRRKFDLTKLPDCSNQVPCPDASAKAPICVKVNGMVVPNDRATGWVYDAASNGIFFDGGFLPPTDAPIEISYTVVPAGATTALSCGSAVK